MSAAERAAVRLLADDTGELALRRAAAVHQLQLAGRPLAAIAMSCGRSRNALFDLKRLNTLPQVVRQAVRSGAIGVTSAVLISRVQQHAQLEVLRRVLALPPGRNRQLQPQLSRSGWGGGQGTR